MTKQEALQKIDELRKFVGELDKQEQLEHGDLVHYPGELQSKRIVIDIVSLETPHRNRFILIDSAGHIQNSFTLMSDIGFHYSKIKNVFKD